MLEGPDLRERLLARRGKDLLCGTAIDKGALQIADGVDGAAPYGLPRPPPEPLLLERPIGALLLQLTGPRVDPLRIVQHVVRLVPLSLEDQCVVGPVAEVIRGRAVEDLGPSAVDPRDDLLEWHVVAGGLVRRHCALESKDQTIHCRKVVTPHPELVDDPAVP